MTQKVIQRKERINKLLSILLVYALFFQEFVPFARSMNAIEFTKKESVDSLLSFEVSSESTFATTGDQADVDNVSTHEATKNQHISLAVTGGPGQSESSGFSLGSTDGMVDKFTGDFSYSIPLMNVEGYPIVINYNSNIGMNTDASWVGLGWDLNVGSVSREMRGLPDEFNGEQKIVKTVNQRDNYTNGSKFGGYLGWRANGSFGVTQLNYPTAQLTALWGKYSSSYQGQGKTFDFGLQAGITIGNETRFGPDFGLGFSRDTKNGIGRNGSIGLGVSHQKDGSSSGYGVDVTYSKNFNSRVGVTSQSIGLGFNGMNEKGTGDKAVSNRGSIGVSTAMSYGSITSVPSIRFSGRGNNHQLSFDGFTEFNTSGAGIWTVGLKFVDYNSHSYLSFTNETSQTIEQDAYGYLHSGKRIVEGKGKDLAVMDFNRTNDFQYSSEMKNLPFSFQTYDIFRANALGMGGTFRAHRTDIGTYSDPRATNTNDGGNANITAGVILGKAVQGKIGVSIGDQSGDSESGNWGTTAITTNGSNVYSFNEEADGSSFDRTVYFMPLGEQTPVDQSQFGLLGGSTIAYLDVNESTNGEEVAQSNYLKVGVGGSFQDGSVINASGDVRRIASTVFRPETAEAASQESLSYLSRNEGEYITSGVEELYRVGGVRDANHLSQVNILSKDGMEYIYGIPAYNIETNEVSFSVGNTPGNDDARPVDVNTNLVRYQTGVGYEDNSINNILGRSRAYDKTTVPAYAHSFLLTELRSSDYIDLGVEGPSVEDIGSYYKFNHTQYYGEKNDGANGRVAGNYKWRFPISDDIGNQAMYNEGFEGTDLDNMATYTYGEKEIWYTHSIESKNFIAEFYLTDRFDAYGVLDENGKLDVNAPLKKLSKIVLYNRADRIENGVNAIPLQTVEFTYNYSLCKNAPGNKHTYSANLDFNKSGKLTLQEIRIYSGVSKEGGLAKYKFDYSKVNPEFNYADVDGWGNYKPNDPNRPNTILPYAEQNATTADENILAWKLVAINNPMGGRVEIDYEADEYVSVQDKRTMKHIDIYRMTNLIEFAFLKDQSNWNGTDLTFLDFRRDFDLTYLQNFVITNFFGANYNNLYKAVFTLGGFSLYSSKFGRFDKDFVPNNVIVFRLDEALSPTDYATKDLASEYVKDAYFKNGSQPGDYMEEILFKTHVLIKTDEEENDIKEYVPAFANISDDFSNPFSGHLGTSGQNFPSVGVMPVSSISGNYEYGYVIVDPVNSGSRERKLKKGTDKDGILLHPIQRAALDFARQNLPDKVYGSCNGCDPDMSIDRKVFWGGDIYKIMIKEGYVPSFENDYSTIRVYVPDSIKFGGNARVSKITYKDNWNTISGEYDSEYSWFYGYSMRTNESGVASYEPQSIIDESPFYYWDTYINTAKKFPDETKFTPTPVAGALFPIPSIGYADVRVRFEGAENYGYSKAEFYTAADYPTVEKVATIDKTYIKKRNVITGNSVDLYGFAQGFVVETNDFHGKPKQFAVYDNLNNIQSRSTYFYNALDEKVPMIDREGNVEYESISMEYDIHADSRFMFNDSRYLSVGASIKFNIPTIIPIVPMPIFHRQKREEGFFSSAFIKHINRSAVVKRVETEYLNSINTAENLLYDRYTGNVLLSSLTDEYEDKLYSMSYPSHWYHRELRDACYADNRVFLGMTLTGATLDLSTASEDVFAVGDKVYVSTTMGGASAEGWILSIDGTTATLINDDGTAYNGLSGTVDVRITQTGRKNRLMETMQSVTTKRPISIPQSGTFIFPENEILSSSAVSYRYKNNMRCSSGEGDKPQIEVESGTVINPFKYGLKGDLVLDGQFAWQSERVNATHTGSNGHKTRFDGSYEDYIPLYKLGADTKWYKLDEASHPDNITTDDYQKWRKLGEVTRYDEYGKAIESQDQIKVHSTVLYGFNKELGLLPVAQAVNARQQEIAFDGFEDYEYYSSNPLSVSETHFDFLEALLPGSVEINNSIRHSGLSSLQINANTDAIVSKQLADGDCLTGNEPVQGAVYTAYPCLCVAPFAPTEGDYVIGAWVKVGSNAATTQYSNVEIQVYVGGSLAATVVPSGPILDGWQRMEGEFTIPQGASGQISVILSNDNLSDQAYFDDLRIHPFLAGMTTTVYDPNTLLPLATHDGYNFTTFYNYDENLNQVRVRVETVEGIQTISETEFGGQKSLNSSNQ